MNRLPYIAVLFVSALLLAADEKPEKTNAPSAAQIQQWVKQLGDESFKVREEATRDLLKAGRVTIDAVTKATKSEDAEVRQRALMILKQFEKAITSLKKLGGEVTVDEKRPGKPVIELSLRHPQVTDGGLVHLKGLANLQGLIIPAQVTDAGLVHLKGLSQLRALGLRWTKTTGVGLEQLKGLTNLQLLTLSDNITDVDLVHLKGLTNLEMLWLDDTKVTGPGLIHLEGLSKLKRLYLRGAKVPQTEIQKLQKILLNCDIVGGL